MGPQYAYRNLILSFMALMAFGFTVALSLAPGTSRPAEADAEVRRLLRSSTGSHSPYTLFEAAQVRPLALSPDKQLLFAVNTPDNRLEVFRIQGRGLFQTASIPVGLEPVAVAARTDREIWVVNHLSDSVSIVELDDHGG